MIRLAIRVARADAELVLAELLELVPAGVEEVDRGDDVEYAVYGAPGELPALPALSARAGGRPIAVSTTEVADDWAQRWREHHRPLVLDGLVVRPPWASAPSDCSGVEVVIDPGQAFGTGAHATTRLCLELLLDVAGERRSVAPPPGVAAEAVLDIGCGSGVLAIAAARLGLGSVRAVDHDPASVEATRQNAAVNDVDIHVSRLDLRTDPLPEAPLVLANLVRGLLLVLARRLRDPPPGIVLARRLRDPPPGILLASGLLTGEADEAAAAFAGAGLVERDRREREGWVALRLQRA